MDFERTLPLGLGSPLLPAPHVSSSAVDSTPKGTPMDTMDIHPLSLISQGEQGEGTRRSPGRDYGVIKVLSFGFSRCGVDGEARITGDELCATPDAPPKAS